MAQNYEESPKLLKDMDESEMRKHIVLQLSLLQCVATPDTLGHLLVILQDDGNAQYCGTVDLKSVPSALRELADRIERQDTVTR